jgi:hypothetical protein
LLFFCVNHTALSYLQNKKAANIFAAFGSHGTSCLGDIGGLNRGLTCVR